MIEASNKLGKVKEVLQEHTNYDYITSSGSVVMLNNDIEFSVTYFTMLLTLLFMGLDVMLVLITGLNDFYTKNNKHSLQKRKFSLKQGQNTHGYN